MTMFDAHLYSDYHDLDGLDHDDIDVNPSTVQKFYCIEIHNSFYYCNKYKRATTIIIQCFIRIGMKARTSSK